MGNLIKLAVTLVIFTLIFRTVDISSVASTIGNASVVYLLAGLLLQFLSTLTASYRWHLIMQALQFGQSFGFYLRSYFKGTFFNQGLPTTIGGDALRVLDVARTGFKKREAFYGVFIDRIIGLLGLLLLNLLANQLNPNLLGPQIHYLINGIVLLSIAGIIFLMALQRLEWLRTNRVGRLVSDLSARLNTVYRSPRRAIPQITLSILIHLLSILAIYSIGRGVGMTFDLLTYLVIIPPVFLLTLIPISLAGWGVREGAMLGLFMLIAADKTQVVSMSIMYGIIVIITSAPGLYVYLRGTHRL